MESVECPPKDFLFPTKLWRVVNNAENCAVIWNSRGNGIVVREDLIESQVMSLDGFKATNFWSFVRQLHYYGFKKSKRWSRDKPNIHHFTHPNFIRNHPELLALVRRIPHRHWCTAQAAVNTPAQPKFLRGYGAVVPPYFLNVPRMPAESYHPNPHPMLHSIPANPNMFHLNCFPVSGFWDSQHNPMAPYYFNPYCLCQGTNQVPAPQHRTPVSLFRTKMASPSTSISQTGIVKMERISTSDSSRHSPVTKHPTNNAQNSPASDAAVDAKEPGRDARQLSLFLSKQGSMINAMMKRNNSES